MLDVLVVDDDFMVASVHSGFVDAVPGCRTVGTAGTGAQALDLVRRLRPDVVLLDLYLPDLPGLEVLARLRADGADVDVVVISAARDAETVRAALRGGVVGYLIKPFSADQLAERLQHVRRTQEALTADVVDQSRLDRLTGVETTEPGAAQPVPEVRLPKGLSPETAGLVRAALAEADGPLSAREVAELLGLSRVAVRRYLEHFVQLGQARVRLRYGTGRPERLYEPV